MVFRPRLYEGMQPGYDLLPICLARISTGIRKLDRTETFPVHFGSFGDNKTVDLDALQASHGEQWGFPKAKAGISVQDFFGIKWWSHYSGTITLSRKPSYFIMNILGPCTLISLLIPVMYMP